VYITEAHAEDEWPIGSKYNGLPCHNQPTSTQERCTIARTIMSQFNEHIQFYVDPITNDFESAFKPWPIRFYVIEKGTLTYKAKPRNGMYDINDLKKYLGREGTQ
jgi:hypothetical protein